MIAFFAYYGVLWTILFYYISHFILYVTTENNSNAHHGVGDMENDKFNLTSDVIPVCDIATYIDCVKPAVGKIITI
jgi:hypothetical protein